KSTHSCPKTNVILDYVGLKIKSPSFFISGYKMSSLFPLISVTICILLSSSAHGVAVMSVDLGSEWMKIAVVSPGKPMEIALNKESKRKTPVAIAFRDGVRLFGEEALNVATRFPENSYHHFLDLIGKTVDHPVVKKYQENFPYHNISGVPGRNTVLFHHKEGIDFTPEELLAMILKQAREIADDFTEQKITDCVITVPVYFNQAERQTMMKVGELADLKVLQLMNVHTAAALNYGAFRRKHFNTTPQNIMLFDMGATDTVVSIISYQVVKTKEAGYLEENPQLSIKGVGYDRSLGGLVMQLKLRDHLAKLFNDQKHKGTTTDIFTSKRAMSKLFKEAGKVMQVLSANPETFAQVEGLIDDIDFKAKVKREAFIALIQDLIDRVRNPVEKALEDAGMTMSRIDQLILVGGATRIPKVQEQLFNVAKKTLGKNLNTDEAPAMGAAYQAAYLSTGFKVKTFVIKESNLFPIKVDFSRDVVNDDGAITVRQVARNLYSYQNPYPLKKVMTFNKHVSDFNFYIGYGDLSHLSDGESQNMENYNISKVKLKGVENALNKHTEEETESKGIKAHFRMDESGIIRLEQAEAEFKKKVEEKAEAEQSTLSKLGSTISNFLSGGSDSADKKDEEKPSKANESTDDKKVDDKPTKTDNDTSSSNGTSSKKETKQIIVKEPIKVLWKQLDLLHMSQDLENRIRKSITKFEEQEKRKRDQDASRNAVESFIL
ncbi:HYOU1 (predicted), partial [Pycnogonum litorale]